MKSNTEQYDQDTSGNLQVRAVESKEALAEPKLKKFTNRRTAAAYKYLTQAVEEKEPWSKELIVQELLPKSDSLCLEIELDDSNKIGAMTEAILHRLNRFIHLTFRESCKLLSILTYLHKTKINIHLPEFHEIG